MKLQYLGHSCFMLEHGAHKVIIDPFLSGNPLAAIKSEKVQADAILVTHGHADHLGDAVEISIKTGAMIIGTFELVNHCISHGAKGHAMHIGGSHDFGFGKVKLTIAHHGSSTDAGGTAVPCGFVVTMGAKTVYHAGDTGLFSDMSLIGSTNRLDCALLPIGDNFTMGIEDAVLAAKMLKPAMAVPMHYNTFDLIRQDPEEFKKGLEGSGIDVRILKPGETLEI